MPCQKKLRGLKINKKYKYKPKKKLLYVGTKKLLEKKKKRIESFYISGVLPKRKYFIKKYYSKFGLYRKTK